MPKFDRKNFGNNIRKIRRSKGLSQKNVADALEVTDATFARYESGEILPNAEQVWKICEELEIYETDLFETGNKIINKENSNNPFKTNMLYLYTIGYFPKSNKFGKLKFKIELFERPDQVKVEYKDYKSNISYLTGYMLADSNVAFIVLENNKENNLRLEVAHIVINIARGTKNDMLGTYTGTNANYIPCTKKCIISKEDKEFTDEMFEKLKITDKEKADIKEKDIWYVDVIDKYTFEE